MTYREQAVRTALTQVGVKESPAGSNSGARVQEYQAATSLSGTGWPWCAAFVNWSFAKAGKPLTELGRSASVGLLLGAAKSKGWAHYGQPARGDIVCFDFDDLDGPQHGDWPDHVGIIVSVNADGSFNSVEGNTSVGNDSNGGEVMVRRRSRAQVEGFIRVPGVKPSPKPYYFELRDGKGETLDHSDRATLAGRKARGAAFSVRVAPRMAVLAIAGRSPRIVMRKAG